MSKEILSLWELGQRIILAKWFNTQGIHLKMSLHKRVKIYLPALWEDSQLRYWIHPNKTSPLCQSILRSLQIFLSRSSLSAFPKNTKFSSSSMWCLQSKRTMKQAMNTIVSMNYRGVVAIARLHRNSSDSKHQLGLNQQNLKSQSDVYRKYKWAATWC